MSQPTPPQPPPTPWPAGTDDPATEPARCATAARVRAVTPEQLGVADDIVSAALHDLGHFGDITREMADQLLSTWVRRDELTDNDRTQVLAYYTPGSGS